MRHTYSLYPDSCKQTEVLIAFGDNQLSLTVAQDELRDILPLSESSLTLLQLKLTMSQKVPSTSWWTLGIETVPSQVL